MRVLEERQLLSAKSNLFIFKFHKILNNSMILKSLYSHYTKAILK